MRFYPLKLAYFVCWSKSGHYLETKSGHFIETIAFRTLLREKKWTLFRLKSGHYLGTFCSTNNLHTARRIFPTSFFCIFINLLRTGSSFDLEAIYTCALVWAAVTRLSEHFHSAISKNHVILSYTTCCFGNEGAQYRWQVRMWEMCTQNFGSTLGWLWIDSRSELVRNWLDIWL